MSKFCPIYNCTVLYADCLECDNKVCKRVVAGKLKIKPGDVMEVKSLFGSVNKFMYLGSTSKGKRKLYRYSDKKIIEVDSDFPKLKRINKIGFDIDLLNKIK